MLSITLVGLIVLTLLVIAIFYLFIVLEFINPSSLQVQLLGGHILLFGVVVLLAFEDSSWYGFTFGLIGFFVGIFGSFRESPKTQKDHVD
ncbi:hypothetical protein GQF01_03955 [Paenibacillus sp. 5J-6]|uniref:Uncharacterized protein n=1 Tax=Paenibacillus silvestris TaxID=2606219 RepID=A0A6L8UTS4_9BACL|nr:hypothetical protein [Paenibacillus silvestris]MZQ81277.1 hypothetical protein [Paenibacillus silvestris]